MVNVELLALGDKELVLGKGPQSQMFAINNFTPQTLTFELSVHTPSETLQHAAQIDGDLVAMTSAGRPRITVLPNRPATVLIRLGECSMSQPTRMRLCATAIHDGQPLFSEEVSILPKPANDDDGTATRRWLPYIISLGILLGLAALFFARQAFCSAGEVLCFRQAPKPVKVDRPVPPKHHKQQKQHKHPSRAW